MDIAGFLSMGGYAAFVWPCYGVAAVLLAGFAIAAVRTSKRNAARLAELERARAQTDRDAA